MRTMTRVLLCAAAMTAALLWPRMACAHCDTLDGPVVRDARAALESGDVTPVLKWVRAEDEPSIRDTFEDAVAVRALGPEARDLADAHFFETLVRIHRAGEGAPFTGLLPAGTPLEPGVAAADHALASGSVDDLIIEITGEVEHALRERFEQVLAARARADESVEAGREYVEAYVEFIHFAERLATDAATPAASHAHAPEATTH